MKTLNELGAAPCPWSVRDVLSICQDLLALDGYRIDEITATANLISAAPEMYRALVKMQEAFDHIRQTAWFIDANFSQIAMINDAQHEADKAIAKAAGEEASND